MIKNYRKLWDSSDKNSKLLYTFEYLHESMQILALHEAYLIYKPYIGNEIIYRTPEAIGFGITGNKVVLSRLEYMGKSADIVETIKGFNIFKADENNTTSNNKYIENRPSMILMESIIRMAAGIFEFRDEERIGIRLSNNRIYPESPFEYAENIKINSELDTNKVIKYINEHIDKVNIQDDLCMLLNRRVRLMMHKDGENWQYIDNIQICIDIIADKLFKHVSSGSSDIIKHVFKEELNIMLNRIRRIIDGIKSTDYA